MYRVISFIFVGYISLTGFASYAQFVDPIEQMFRQMASGGSSGGSSSDIGGSIAEQIMGSTGVVEQQTSAIEEGQSLVADVVVPEVNQTVVDVIDTRTGRYPPRLKVNFREFPLRSLAAKNGSSADEKPEADIVVQRIQKRLRVPNIELVVEDRTAIISGTVATEGQRNIAASMLRFEPGIDTVKNNLSVVSQ